MGESGNIAGETVPSETRVAIFTSYTVAPQVEQLLEEHLGSKAKILMPTQHQERVVRLFPWLTLVFMPLHIAVVTLALGMTALASLVGHFSWFGALLSASTLVCQVLSLPGLFKRTRQGWAFFVYGYALVAMHDLVNFSAFGLLTSALVMWGAFQVKYRYT